MTDANIRKLDFNLLMIFRAVMNHRQLTAAASELGLTQSALSHALKRLRAIVGQDLFIRRQLGVEPTELAQTLIGPVEKILATAEAALAPPDPFEPATSSQSLAIAAGPVETAIFAPPVAALLADATAMSVTFVPADANEALAALDDGTADLALGDFADTPDRIAIDVILKTPLVVAAAKKNPAIKKKLSWKKYLSAGHVAVAGRESVTRSIDGVLADTGHRRRIVATVADPVQALVLASDGPLLATVPSVLASRWAKPLGLRLFNAPVLVTPIRIALARHERRAHDPAIGWLADKLSKIGEKMPA